MNVSFRRGRAYIMAIRILRSAFIFFIVLRGRRILRVRNIVKFTEELDPIIIGIQLDTTIRISMKFI